MNNNIVTRYLAFKEVGNQLLTAKTARDLSLLTLKNEVDTLKHHLKNINHASQNRNDQ